MNAVVPREPTAPAKRTRRNAAVPATDVSASLMAVIAQAARDPAVDVDKMERLLAMQERVIDRRAESDFSAAFAAMSAELPEIEERGKITVRDKNDSKRIIQSTGYALWEDIHRAIKPILNKHGFALAFEPGNDSNGRVEVTGILSHVGGHTRRAKFNLPNDSSGSKNAVQGAGSALSYGKRYVACAMLNITTIGADDDGAKSGPVVNHDVQVSGPVSSNKLRKDGAWEAMMRDINSDLPDVHTLMAAASVRATYLERARMEQWPPGWVKSLNEEFDAFDRKLERELALIRARDDERDAAL